MYDIYVNTCVKCVCVLCVSEHRVCVSKHVCVENRSQTGQTEFDGD